MYPLNAFLIGIEGSLRTQVRDELQNQQIHIASEKRDVASAVDLDRQVAEWTGSGNEKPRLFIIYLASSRDGDRLQRLRRAYPGQPIVVLLENENDPAAVITTMREGASQVVLLPLQETDFRAALEAIAQQYGSSAKPSRLLAVSGVTGGCGATTLALNLAYELATEHQTRCLLVDLSLQIGMLATYLNIEPQSTIHDVLQDIPNQHLYAVQKGITRVAENLQMIAGPYQSIKPMEVKPQEVLLAVRYCKRLAELVILDVPGTYDDLYFKILAACDQVILVAEQRVPSIRAAKLVCDRLACEAILSAPHLVINRYNPRLKGFILNELEKLLPVRHLSSIVNDEAAVTEAVNQGRPLRQAAPQSRALADIDALAQSLAGIRTPAKSPAGDFSVFVRLVRAFGLT